MFGFRILRTAINPITPPRASAATPNIQPLSPVSVLVVVVNTLVEVEVSVVEA